MQGAKFFEKQPPDFSKTCGRRKSAAIPNCNQMGFHLIATWYQPEIPDGFSGFLFGEWR
jgi:hypothetical protein